MPRFFFDTRDGPLLIRDEEGFELAGIEEVRDEATRGLADMAKDVLPCAMCRELAVEVRDAADHPILQAALSFKVAIAAEPSAAPGFESPG